MSIFFSISMMHPQKENDYGCSSWFSYDRCLCNAGVEVLTLFCVLIVSSASDINLFRVVKSVKYTSYKDTTVVSCNTEFDPL